VLGFKKLLHHSPARPFASPQPDVPAVGAM
jgi:hypothetical protein